MLDYNNNNNEVYLQIRPINSSRRVQCKKIWYIDSKKVIRQHLTLKCSTSCVQTIKIEDIYLHSIEI